jgi:Peptidase inhibitor family I36
VTKIHARRFAAAVSGVLLAAAATALPAAAEPVPIPTGHCSGGYVCFYDYTYFDESSLRTKVNSTVSTSTCVQLVRTSYQIASIINRSNSDWAVYKGDSCRESDRIALIYARTANNNILFTPTARDATHVRKLF